MRKLNATYITRGDGGLIAVTYRLHYCGIGTTIVETPNGLANDTWPDDPTVTPSETRGD